MNEYLIREETMVNGQKTYTTFFREIKPITKKWWKKDKNNPWIELPYDYQRYVINYNYAVEAIRSHIQHEEYLRGHEVAEVREFIINENQIEQYGPKS